MDKIDRTILELIKDNARMSYSEIGKSAGLVISAKTGQILEQTNRNFCFHGKLDHRPIFDPKNLGKTV